MNLLVVAVYWSVLYDKQVVRYTASKEFLNITHSIVIHSVPLIANIANFLVTDIVVKASHALVLFPIGLVYSYHNYSSTVRTGQPVYWFLDWQDNTSAIIVTSMTFGCALFFIFMSWLSKKVRSLRPIPDSV
mmetsp:Transcript_6240/g.8343  ORF Transcript_6240/g.8343 Transcript_6240/m.8343 type:complete len:132 (-) Transcript_6240:103-498(-)